MVVCGGFHGDLFSMWPREYIEGYGVLAQKDVGVTCWSFGLHTEHSLDWPLVLRSQQRFATCS